LAKQVDEIKWSPEQSVEASKMGGRSALTINVKNGSPIELRFLKDGTITDSSQSSRADWKGKKLEEVIGKGVAEKVLSKSNGSLMGESLNIGGEWAKNLYDKQFKDIVEKLTGGKVEYKDLGLPVEGEKRTTAWLTRSKTEGVGKVLPSDLKVGKEIYKNGQDDAYIITDILGDGKFKAVPKLDYTSGTQRQIENATQTFDISTPKSTQQPILQLTPEIKAKIQGKAPDLKQPSGVSPFGKLMPKLTTQ
jgi:hypothetical protein